jgi:GAF domain-containing protein
MPRSKTGGKRVIAARRRTATAKDRGKGKAARRASSSAAWPKATIARLTQELNEAAEQQKATSEVLRVISNSSGDLQPAFAALLANAVRVCDADNGAINRWDGEALHLMVTHNLPPAYAELRKRAPYRLDQHSISGRMLATRAPVQIADLASDRSYVERNPPTVAAVEMVGVRTTLAVPMFKDNELVGSFTVGRTQVRPFTDKQVELAQSFATKAVIAIDNARLLHELRESLQYQTATAKVLQVISSSSDLQLVFDTVLENARRLCDAEFGNIYRWDGEALHLIAWQNTPPAFAEYRRRGPFRPSATSLIGRMVKSRQVTHVTDAAANVDYTERRDPSLVAAVELGGVRTYLAVPMLKDGELIGAVTLFRQQVRPFTDKQITLTSSFADQISIAIENARLLHELRETLQQQTAAADVLTVISRSTFDLQAVLDMLIKLAVELCDADLGGIHREERPDHRAIAVHGGPPGHKEAARSVSLQPGRGSVLARTMLERKPVHVADVLADPDYALRAAQQSLGYRTALGVPLLREGNPIGVIVLMRLAVRPFTQKQIDLVQSFASQAIIAIENTRLLTELRRRTDELGRSVAELQRERNNKLMNLQAMAASISHEVRQPLAGIASNGGAALRFLRHAPPNLEEARSALNSMIRDSHRASQVFDNIGALFGRGEHAHASLDVNELALGILEMLRHDLNDRAVTAQAALASELPLISGHRGPLQEVLVNLVRNAIEAMEAVEPERRVLQLRTQRHGDSAILVAVEDSGPGMDQAQLDDIFDAFVTTKPNGMGLGLAICRMIIERHAGQLWASPAHPRGCIFQIVLPARGSRVAEKNQGQ